MITFLTVEFKPNLENTYKAVDSHLKTKFRRNSDEINLSST